MTDLIDKKKHRVPDFLVIGAMKSATTTLFNDLSLHPKITAPLEKEPGNLKSDATMEGKNLKRYLSLFESVEAGQKTFEASTMYTMRPHYEGVAERALKWLGSDLKVIYLLREPVSRCISHHAHLYAMGEYDNDINVDIYKFPGIIEYSRYYYQIKPYLRIFGEENVFVLTHDFYVENRKATLNSIFKFLDLSPMDCKVPMDSAANKRSDLRKHSLASRLLINNPLYVSHIKKQIPDWVKAFGKNYLMKKPDTGTTPVGENTRRHIYNKTRDDIRAIAPYVRHGKETAWLKI